jgi:DNA-binding GntR family transcriptional regulator
MDRMGADARRGAVLAEHEQICTAIAKGEATAARDAMAKHIQDIVDNTLRVLASTDSGRVGRALTEEELSYVP